MDGKYEWGEPIARVGFSQVTARILTYTERDFVDQFTNGGRRGIRSIPRRRNKPRVECLQGHLAGQVVGQVLPYHVGAEDLLHEPLSPTKEIDPPE